MINRIDFPPHLRKIFDRVSSRLEDGWDRDMLAREFSNQELGAVLYMHEKGYGYKGEHAPGFDPKSIAFWMDFYEWWTEWQPTDLIPAQPVPRPGMLVQRRGSEPTKVVAYFPPGTLRVMPGDERVGWVKTEDGITSCDGSYRVLGYPKSE